MSGKSILCFFLLQPLVLGVSVSLLNAKPAPKRLMIQAGHSHSPSAIAFSTDGTCFATADFLDVRVWDARTNRLTAVFRLAGTKEGLWFAGEKILCNCDDRIYLLDPKRLTTTRAPHRLSPKSARRVLRVDGEYLWLTRIGHKGETWLEARRLLDSSISARYRIKAKPSWAVVSTSGQFILFALSGAAGVFCAEASGSNLRRVGDAKAISHNGSIILGMDGKTAVMAKDGSGPALYDLSVTAPKLLAQLGATAQNITYTNTGKFLFWREGDRIYRADLTQPFHPTLFSASMLDSSPPSKSDPLAGSPDGETVVFASGGWGGSAGDKVGSYTFVIKRGEGPKPLYEVSKLIRDIALDHKHNRVVVSYIEDGLTKYFNSCLDENGKMFNVNSCDRECQMGRISFIALDRVMKSDFVCFEDDKYRSIALSDDGNTLVGRHCSGYGEEEAAFWDVVTNKRADMFNQAGGDNGDQCKDNGIGCWLQRDRGMCGVAVHPESGYVFMPGYVSELSDKHYPDGVYAFDPKKTKLRQVITQDKLSLPKTSPIRVFSLPKNLGTIINKRLVIFDRNGKTMGIICDIIRNSPGKKERIVQALLVLDTVTQKVRSVIYPRKSFDIKAKSSWSDVDGSSVGLSADGKMALIDGDMYDTKTGKYVASLKGKDLIKMIGKRRFRVRGDAVTDPGAHVYIRLTPGRGGLEVYDLKSGKLAIVVYWFSNSVIYALPNGYFAENGNLEGKVHLVKGNSSVNVIDDKSSFNKPEMLRGIFKMINK